MDFETINPATGELIASYSYLSPGELQEKLEVARSSQFIMHSMPMEDRRESVLFLGQILRDRKRELAALITREMGKPISQALAEIEKCAVLCEKMVQHCEIWGEVQRDIPHYEVRRHSFGIVMGIMPWNFPFWQVFRFAVPALLSGNIVLLKHADQVTGCAELLQIIFREAFANPFFTQLRISHEQAKEVMAWKHLGMVSFTGSTQAGKQIAETCGRNLKKCVLELGGNDPYIVLPSADVSFAAKSCTQGRLINTGQSCVSAKRFLVHGSVMEEFIRAMMSEFEKYKFGNPMEVDTTLGPLAHSRFVPQLEAQRAELQAAGYESVYTGIVPENLKLPKTAFINTQIFRKTGPENFYDQEIFGPIAVCYSYTEEKQIIPFVNESEFGLGSAIFGKDMKEVQSFLNEAHVGYIAVNDFVKSDPEVPFGGWRSSGYGRELGKDGYLEFSQAKTIYIKGIDEQK